METTNTISNLEEKIHNACINFFHRMGYEIVDDTPDKFEIVAKEEDKLIFVLSSINDNTSEDLKFVAPDLTRTDAEIAAMRWLSEHSDISNFTPVRFDTFCLTLIGNGKAFLRHHANAFAFRGEID